MQEFTSGAEMRAFYADLKKRTTSWARAPVARTAKPIQRPQRPTECPGRHGCVTDRAGAAPPPKPEPPPPPEPPALIWNPHEALIWNCRAAWDRQSTFDRVIWACCTYYDVPIGDMRSGMRTDQVVQARQVAIYLMHTILPRKTSSVIGRAFRRDHSTVLYAVQVVSRRIMSGDEELDRVLRFLYRAVLGDESDRVQFDELCSV